MAEHDITLVTAKAGSVIAENMKVSLATASGGITPATLTAMVGIAQGGAVQVAPAVGNALTALAAVPNTAPYYGAAQTAITDLTSLRDDIFAGGPAGFGQILMQAQGHIEDSLEIKKAMNFMANTSFDEFGVGISSMSSMVTQGIDKVVGNITAASNAMSIAGPLYDLTDMKNFGSPVGFINKLNSSKLANATGVKDALAKAGVDLTRLDDPVYIDSINNALASITDPTAIKTVIDEFGVIPFGQINNFRDFTDLSKLANPADIQGLTASLTDIGSKFSDIGGKFGSASAASTFFNQIEIPSVPNLDAATPSIAGMVSNHTGTINNLTGTGNGPLGLPNLTNFVEAVAGGPTIDALLANVNATTVGAISSMVTNARSLITKAGIDLTTPAPNNLGSAMSFATSLHRLGADATGSGVTSVLSNMSTADQYGDAIKAALTEGKNKALMAANGIKELVFKS